MTELALISFDGLDPRVIYNNEDKLPNLYSFMEESVHGKWLTPGHTIPSYTATLTGLQYHSYDFRWDEGGEYSRHRQTGYDYLWDLTDAPMTLLNIPVLYPPEPIDDCMVCGMLTPDELATENLAQPKEAQEILNDIGYIHEVRSDKTYDELGPDGMLKNLHDMMIRRRNAAGDLLNTYESDLFYGVWTAPDRWFHKCFMEDELYKDKESNYMRMYMMADDIAGDLIKMLPDDIPMIIFSDHGFRHSRSDNGVHKGHKFEGWYSMRVPSLPSYRDDSANIFDLFPTVLNYFGEDIPSYSKGRILFHREDQDQEVQDRLEDLGYID